MKKRLLFALISFLVVFSVIIVLNSVQAQIMPPIAFPDANEDWQPITETVGWGTPTVPWAAGYFSNLYASSTYTGILTVTATTTSPLLLDDGTAGAPAYSWMSDPNSGLYRIGSDNIGMTLGGSLIYDFGTTSFDIGGVATVTLATGNIATQGNLTVTGSTTFNGIEYLFPATDGSASDMLITDGAGGLSWTIPATAFSSIAGLNALLSPESVASTTWAGASSILTTGALDAGSITANFGTIDNGTSNITTGGIIRLDVDGSAINAAGSIGFGAATTDSAIYWNGTNLEIDTTAAIELSISGTTEADLAADGFNIITGDSYQINNTSVLNATTLGSSVVGSSLTSVGALAGGSITTGFTDIPIAQGGTGASTLAGASIPTYTSTNIFTNKRITSRVVTTTDDASAEIDTDITDVYDLSAIANATTFTLTGTPTDGQKLMIRFKDAGTTKGLTWTGFTAIGVTLPTDTTATKQHYVGCVYNGTTGTPRWECIAVGEEA